jgi:outer membrane protein
MQRKTILVALALAGLSAAAAAQAQTHTVTIGGAFIDVHSKAPPLHSTPPTLPPGVDARIEVDDAKTVVFGYEYRFTPQWGLEAALGIPPEHKTYGRDFIEAFGHISSVKQVAPTVFVNYHFNDVLPKFSPFVGLGINYTKFTDARSTPSGNAASGGPTRIKLSDSWGLAGHVGFSYELAPQWSLVGTIATAKVKSDVTATTTTTTGDIVRTTTIDFRPVVYTLSVGYSF